MNVIVKRHYPVEKLPDDLREGIGIVGAVTVTIQEEVPLRDDRAELIRRLRDEKARMKDGEGVTVEQAVARVRELRDEWDD